MTGIEPCVKCGCRHREEESLSPYIDSFLDEDGNCTFNPEQPCLYCGLPVGHLSMGGPLVCPSCDCGHHRDGTRWTLHDAILKHARAREALAELKRRTKWCYNCHQHKPVADFHSNRHKRDGLSSECRGCSTAVQRAYQARYYKTHRDALLPRHRASALASIRKKRLTTR